MNEIVWNDIDATSDELFLASSELKKIIRFYNFLGNSPSYDDSLTEDLSGIARFAI